MSLADGVRGCFTVSVTLGPLDLGWGASAGKLGVVNCVRVSTCTVTLCAMASSLMPFAVVVTVMVTLSFGESQ